MKKQYFVEKTLAINASPQTIFDVLLQVEKWSQWTASINEIAILNNDSLKPGAQLKVSQPKLSPAVWTVTVVDPDKALVWEKQSAGLKMISEHFITGDADAITATIRMTYTGFWAPLAYLLTKALTNNYMEMEINGLKKACEKNLA